VAKYSGISFLATHATTPFLPPFRAYWAKFNDAQRDKFGKARFWANNFACEEVSEIEKVLDEAGLIDKKWA
jgi:hypothetical protein